LGKLWTIPCEKLAVYRNGEAGWRKQEELTDMKERKLVHRFEHQLCMSAELPCASIEDQVKKKKKKKLLIDIIIAKS
jgi:hypothetical protein